jgi:hypothetical protein
VHPGWVRSYMEGRLNTEATIEPIDSAKGIYRLLHNRKDVEGPIYVDYEGNELNW